MTSDHIENYTALLIEDGRLERLAETSFEAATREIATSKALEWAIASTWTGISAPMSLFLRVDDRDWLIKRWGDV